MTRKSVPTEATDEMLFAAKEAVKDWSEFGIEWLEDVGEGWRAAYRAMVEAAPLVEPTVTERLQIELQECVAEMKVFLNVAHPEGAEGAQRFASRLRFAEAALKKANV